MTGEVFQIAVVFVVLGLVFLAFLRDWLPGEVIALLAAAALLAAGVLETGEVTQLLGNNALFTIACMFILSGALERTGCIEALGNWITRLAGNSALLGFMALIGFAVTASAFVNNTPVVVVLIPVAVRLCQHFSLAPSKLLMPLSFAAIFGGTCTLIGTSTNLVVDGVMRELGEVPFGIFEITGFGLVMAVIGLLYLLTIGQRLMPDRTTPSRLLSEMPTRRFLTELVVPGHSNLIGKTLSESRLDSVPQARIADLIRHDESLRRERAETPLEAGDRLVVKADVAGLMALRERTGIVFNTGQELDEVGTRQTMVAEGVIGPRSSLIGKRLASAHLRRRFGVYILAVHRQGENLGNFEETRLRVGDSLLLEGEHDDIRRLIAEGEMINMTEPQEHPLRPDKAPIAIAAVLGVVVLAAFNVMPIAGLALIGVALVILTRCIEPAEAFRAIHWPVLMIIFGMMTLGLAMEKTGAAAAIATSAIQSLSGFGPLAMLSAVYFLTSLLTAIVSNAAVAALMAPIAIGIASQLGLDPRPFIVAVMFGGSASFATPVGYQTNTLVYTAGGYRYMDFVKVGLPLNILFWAVATFLIPLFWPFVAS